MAVHGICTDCHLSLKVLDVGLLWNEAWSVLGILALKGQNQRQGCIEGLTRRSLVGSRNSGSEGAESATGVH